MLSMLTTGTSGKFTAGSVVDTGRAAGVIDTVGRIPSVSQRSMEMPPVSMTPLVHFSLGISSRIFEKIKITELMGVQEKMR